MSKEAERRARLSYLYEHAPRDEYFEAAREAITEYFLADPSNPYQQSGTSSGPERWKMRRCIVQAIHRDGDFLDVGCANGLLLECLVGWAAESGFTIRPHGLDFVPELLELARQRLARFNPMFELANAFYWRPTRRYDFVRTNLEYVQRPDWPEFLARQFSAVADGGRLIVCHYRNVEDEILDVPALLTRLGYDIVGHAEVPGKSVAWCERSGQPAT
jgi:SAM-dependent methyltransferase